MCIRDRHYPGDVLTGIFIGALLGTSFAFAHNKLRVRFLKNNNPDITTKHIEPGSETMT
jgi:hypothetical protein